MPSARIGTYLHEKAFPFIPQSSASVYSSETEAQDTNGIGLGTWRGTGVTSGW